MCKESKNNALFKKRTDSLERERVISVDHLRGIVLIERGGRNVVCR